MSPKAPHEIVCMKLFLRAGYFFCHPKKQCKVLKAVESRSVVIQACPSCVIQDLQRSEDRVRSELGMEVRGRVFGGLLRDRVPENGVYGSGPTILHSFCYLSSCFKLQSFMHISIDYVICIYGETICTETWRQDKIRSTLIVSDKRRDHTKIRITTNHNLDMVEI